MKQILEVCVGSSCHLKGAYGVISEFRRLLAEYALEDQIDLKACFCLGECQDGVSIRYNQQIFTSITKENASDFFTSRVLAVDGREGLS